MTATLRLSHVLLLASALFASPTGRITGIVRDPSGAARSGARIAASFGARGERRSLASDSDGAFEFLDVAPGTWSLTVESEGFRATALPEVVVHIDRVARVEIRLEIGKRTETVTVASTLPDVEMSRPTEQTAIDSRVVSNMPLNGRQYLDLALLAAGTVAAAPGTQGSGFSVSGIRSQSNVYLLDGIGNIDTQTNQPLNLFRITDAVGEFTVQTSVPPPEFGRGAGAQVNVVTR